MIQYKNLNINITTSNSENINLAFDKSEKLLLNFLDYSKQEIEVSFKNVKAFAYKNISENSEHKNDQIYEIIKSKWLMEELAEYSEDQLESFAHFMFCFNKYNKALHVICDKDFEFKIKD